ncbi:MAG: radical SAM protein [Oscillibacter sp.]|nr:radical SAM protein [Oscillibacter sp.]
MENELMERMNKLENMFLRFQPRSQLQFEVDITRHCNLNCEYCGLYSPLANKEFLDPEEYRRDCARLSELFHGEMRRVYLLGGEPLLHPQITELMKITRESFPIGIIRILTNGILLPKMDDAFWQSCSRYGVEVTTTEYPIQLDYSACSDLAEKHGVAYLPHVFSIDPAYKKTMGRDIISLKSMVRPEYNFAHCSSANLCLTLSHGKLYSCGVAANIHILKDYFHLDMPISQQNGVDIYAVESGEELMRGMAKAMPLCGHCDLSVRGVEWDWRVSRRDRYEWLGFEFLEEDFQYLREAAHVYVFGAAAVGMETVRRLQRGGIHVDAVLATRTEGKPETVLGVPLRNLQDIEPIAENSVCLMAVHSYKTKAEVFPILCKHSFKNVLPVYGFKKAE